MGDKNTNYVLLCVNFLLFSDLKEPFKSFVIHPSFYKSSAIIIVLQNRPADDKRMIEDLATCEDKRLHPDLSYF